MIRSLGNTTILGDRVASGLGVGLQAEVESGSWDGSGQAGLVSCQSKSRARIKTGRVLMGEQSAMKVWDFLSLFPFLYRSL